MLMTFKVIDQLTSLAIFHLVEICSEDFLRRELGTSP
jgi:hypothetical protein